MAILNKKRISPIRNKKATDIFDKVIFENDLRIYDFLIARPLDLIVVVLSNGVIVKSKISEYPKLAMSSETQLNNWKLIGDGIGIEWPELNEDLSLKGFIKGVNIKKIMRTLRGDQEKFIS